MNLACVLLNNPVGNGKSKTCSTSLAWSGRGFCREKRIVNALEVLGRDAGTGVGNNGFDMAIEQGCDAEAAAARHRFFGVQQEVEKHLLQFAGIAVNAGQVVDQVGVDDDWVVFKLVFEQRECIANDLVEVGFAELSGGGAREVQQAVRDFRCAE